VPTGVYRRVVSFPDHRSECASVLDFEYDGDVTPLSLNSEIWEEQMPGGDVSPASSITPIEREGLEPHQRLLLEVGDLMKDMYEAIRRLSTSSGGVEVTRAMICLCQLIVRKRSCQ